MNTAFLFLILALGFVAHGSKEGVPGKSSLEVAKIPAGRIELFWISPKAKVLEEEGAKEEKGPEKNIIFVKEFQSMVHAVTRAQFEEFLNQVTKWKKEKVSPLFADQTYLDSEALKSLSPRSPITNVSWFAAQAFCEHHGMRLPTVYEWEYMAAASEKAADANRDEPFLRRILNWYGETRPEKIPSVKSIYKNKYKIWDLHGLIWEWVYDFNSSFVTGESREDGSLNKNYFCGAGSMNSSDKENYAAFMRFAFRSSLRGKSSAWNLGFRCVRSL